MSKKNIHFLLKRINLFFLCTFFIMAGINHFWHPAPYLSLVPPYFPGHYLIVTATGIAEIFAGLLMIIPSARRSSAILIIALLIAFIPAHIYMIQLKGCVSKDLCVPGWLAWVRLFPFQFILMWWAWKTYRWQTG